VVVVVDENEGVTEIVTDDVVGVNSSKADESEPGAGEALRLTERDRGIAPSVRADTIRMHMPRLTTKVVMATR